MRLCVPHRRSRFIGWRRSRATDSCIFAQEDFIGVKSLALPRVLANIRRPVMETVWVLDIWKIWRKLEEKVEKIWRKLVEHFSLPSSCALVLNEKVSLECFLHFLRFSDMTRLHLSNLIFLTPVCFWDQRAFLALYIGALCVVKLLC